MRAAQSSHVDAYEYDAQSQLLHIRFTNGAVYQYEGVDANTAHTFSQSQSKGAYFHQKIKGNFPVTQLTGGGRKRKK